MTSDTVPDDVVFLGTVPFEKSKLGFGPGDPVSAFRIAGHFGVSRFAGYFVVMRAAVVYT
jgi:hypothetical protein